MRLCLGLLMFALVVPVTFAGVSPEDALEHGILTAENDRQADAPALVEGLAHRNPRLRTLSLRALGRIGSLESWALIEPSLTDRNIQVREQAAFAAGLIGGESVVAALRAAFGDERVATVREQLAFAVGRAGTLADVQWLRDRIANRRETLPVRGRAAHGLGLLLMRLPADTALPENVLESLIPLTQRHGPAATGAAFALARYAGLPTEAQAEALRDAFATAEETDARAYLVRAVAKVKVAAARRVLAEAVADESTPDSVRIEALRALGGFPNTPETIAALTPGLEDTFVQTQIQALQSLERFGTDAAALSGRILTLAATSPSDWVKETALITLATIDPAAARPLAEASISWAWPANAGALRALSRLGTDRDLDLVLSRLSSENLREAAVAAESASGFSDAQLDARVRGPFFAALSRPDLALTSFIADTAARRHWAEFAPGLVAVYAAFTRPDDLEAKVVIITALGELGDTSVLPMLEEALVSEDHAIAVAAAAAILKLTGQDVSDRIPPAGAVRGVTPPISELRAATKAKVRLTTTRGAIVLAMNDEAPLNAYNFVSLVRSGFYDGLTLHRVVPHFVAQGGDPRGDGYGGPGYMVRDEATISSHTRGAVGIATAGKDTGGCQFFINHGANLHLDGSYTVFARVIAGMNNADELEIGDVITSAEVQ